MKTLIVFSLALASIAEAATFATLTSNRYVIGNPGALFATLDEDALDTSNLPLGVYVNCIDRDRLTNTPFSIAGTLSSINSVTLAAAALLFVDMPALATQHEMTEHAYAVWKTINPAVPNFGASSILAANAMNQATALAGDYSSLSRVRLFTPLNEEDKEPFQRFLTMTQGGGDEGVPETPEPATFAMIGLGLAALGWRKRA